MTTFFREEADVDNRIQTITLNQNQAHYCFAQQVQFYHRQMNDGQRAQFREAYQTNFPTVIFEVNRCNKVNGTNGIPAKPEQVTHREIVSDCFEGKRDLDVLLTTFHRTLIDIGLEDKLKFYAINMMGEDLENVAAFQGSDKETLFKLNANESEGFFQKLAGAFYTSSEEELAAINIGFINSDFFMDNLTMGQPFEASDNYLKEVQHLLKPTPNKTYAKSSLI
jgi:hypothetical protein